MTMTMGELRRSVYYGQLVPLLIDYADQLQDVAVVYGNKYLTERFQHTITKADLTTMTAARNRAYIATGLCGLITIIVVVSALR